MFKYHCTGQISTSGFPEFLKNEIGEPRKNIRLFSDELKDVLGAGFISLVNSGSSANLVAAMMVKEFRPDRNKVLLSGFTFSTTIISAFKNAWFQSRVD